ncbi:MAG: membrane protein insertase YidC [Legionellaceae bacterium]|nr:membrane protein insertase YidC [Legionellaceae bacterium]
MDIRRVILFSILALIGYNLWLNWQQDYPGLPPATPTALHESSAVPVKKDQALLPTVSDLPDQDTTAPGPGKARESHRSTTASRSLIDVKTDVLHLQVDPQQGDIVSAQLLDYPLSVEQKDQPITLLTTDPQHRYTANSSLFQVRNGQIHNLDFNFTATQTAYHLESGENTVVLRLTGQSEEGLEVEKRFTLERGSYVVKVSYHINNQTDQSFQAYFNRQLLRQSPVEDQSSIFHVGSYTGASYSSPGEQRFKKVSFKDMSKANLNVKANNGWIAMQQHYFLSAWVPQDNTKNTFYTRADGDTYTIGAVSPLIKVAPQQQKTLESQLYVGPEISSNLKALAPGLDLTIDYGWLWFLSSLLFSLMKSIHSVVGNWGWSIVLVTVLIKLAFYRLSATSYKSMANMRKLQPKLESLRERYGDDKAKMSQATMELYRSEKVNPLGGCLPILVQIPVFIALYWVLLESVELRQAPFIGWIHDLSVADPYHILPIIMGITMLIQQRLNPAPPDPMQAKIMMFLPILFTALFWNFPAGLVLYWIVNNSLSILQQWYITNKYSDKNKSLPKNAAANQ